MQQVTLDVFKFNELTDEVQENLVRLFREKEEYLDDGILEDLSHFLNDCGFSGYDIEYSLDFSHVPFAKIVGGCFNKPEDLTEARKRASGEAIDEIFNMIAGLSSTYFDVGDEDDEIEHTEEEQNLIKLISEFLFAVILNDCENFYDHDNICEWFDSLDADYLKNGTMIDIENK